MVNKTDFGSDLPNCFELGHLGINYPEKQDFFINSNKLNTELELHFKHY